MDDGPRNVLFLCTGNSARSILAEAILNRFGRGRFRAFSAGSRPTGTVNPYAVELLSEQGFPGEGLRSKSWDEFACPGAPAMHLVITVCDNAAGEACPTWPGHPAVAHWGVDDPAAESGGDDARRRAMAAAFDRLSQLIQGLVELPVDSMDAETIRREIASVGRRREGGLAKPSGGRE